VTAGDGERTQGSFHDRFLSKKYDGLGAGALLADPGVQRFPRAGGCAPPEGTAVTTTHRNFGNPAYIKVPFGRK